MSFERKILLSIAAMILAFVPPLAGAFFTIREIVTDQRAIIDVNARQVTLAEQLRTRHACGLHAMPVFVITGDPKKLHLFESAHHEFNQALAEFIGLEQDAQTRALAEKLRREANREYEVSRPGIKLRQDGVAVARVDRYFRAHVAPVAEMVTRLIHELSEIEAKDLKQAEGTFDSTLHRMMCGLIVLAALAIFLTICSARLTMNLLRRRRQADEHERRLSNARKEVVEVVAHDLKNPLASLQMTLELLKHEAPESLPREFQQGLHLMERAAQSMHQLVSDLLDHARIESRHLVLDPRSCDLRAFIEDVRLRFEPLAQAKQIRLDAELPSEPVFSCCDPARLDQALSNLISNALRFTPRDGCIRITGERVGKDVVISVEDSGPGLTREQIAHVFDRYWQVRQTGQGNLGLGLAIVKGIVDAHRGHVWVQSAPGRGAKFSIALPA